MLNKNFLQNTFMFKQLLLYFKLNPFMSLDLIKKDYRRNLRKFETKLFVVFTK